MRVIIVVALAIGIFFVCGNLTKDNTQEVRFILPHQSVPYRIIVDPAVTESEWISARVEVAPVSMPQKVSLFVTGDELFYNYHVTESKKEERPHANR